MAQRSKGQSRSLGNPTPLTAAQNRALAGLTQTELIDELYLAGGGAIAHYVRHRRSADIDLFSVDADLNLERVRRWATEVLTAEVVSQTEATLTFRLAGAMVDVVNYPYQLLVRTQRGPHGVRIAGLRDLAAMKLAAIAKRGVRRDYWDLFEILANSKITLRRACDDYMAKFGVSEADLYHVLRATTWFDDAEADPTLPRGLTKTKWVEIRSFFETHAPKELLRRTRT